ncbi:MAG: hypothetical protein KF686_17120 [Ramlibacter sp.]|nr:hypothetical protein [Ramlibacter sp.]
MDYSAKCGQQPLIVRSPAASHQGQWPAYAIRESQQAAHKSVPGLDRRRAGRKFKGNGTTPTLVQSVCKIVEIALRAAIDVKCSRYARLIHLFPYDQNAFASVKVVCPGYICHGAEVRRGRRYDSSIFKTREKRFSARLTQRPDCLDSCVLVHASEYPALLGATIKTLLELAIAVSRQSSLTTANSCSERHCADTKGRRRKAFQWFVNDWDVGISYRPFVRMGKGDAAHAKAIHLAQPFDKSFWRGFADYIALAWISAIAEVLTVDQTEFEIEPAAVLSKVPARWAAHQKRSIFTMLDFLQRDSLPFGWQHSRPLRP